MPGETIGCHTDHSPHANGDLRKCKRIIATYDEKILMTVTQDQRALCHITSRFFDARDIRQLG